MNVSFPAQISFNQEDGRYFIAFPDIPEAEFPTNL